MRAEKFKELGEHFEKEEDRLLCDEGFEKTVEEVSAIEKQTGDLRPLAIHGEVKMAPTAFWLMLSSCAMTP